MPKRRIVTKQDGTRVVIEGNQIVHNLPPEAPVPQAGVASPIEGLGAESPVVQQATSINALHQAWLESFTESHPGVDIDLLEDAEPLPEAMTAATSLLGPPRTRRTADPLPPDRSADDIERAMDRRNNLTTSTLISSSTANLDRLGPGVQLPGADLRGGNFMGVSLVDANLEGANLGHTNFTGVDLRAARLAHARVEGADFRGADLRGADLRGVVTKNTDMREADLRGADVSAADLRGALMWNTKVEGLTSDEDTRWPEEPQFPAETPVSV